MREVEAPFGWCEPQNSNHALKYDSDIYFEMNTLTKRYRLVSEIYLWPNRFRLSKVVATHSDHSDCGTICNDLKAPLPLFLSPYSNGLLEDPGSGK